MSQEFLPRYLRDLVARKLAGPEQSTLPEADVGFHEGEVMRLEAMLRAAHEKSQLPEAPSAGAALNDLLVRMRMEK